MHRPSASTSSVASVSLHSSFLLLAAGLASVGAAHASPVPLGADEAAWIREQVGVYIWPGFDLPGYDYTVGEQADIAAELGTRIVRVIYEPHQLGQTDFVALARTPDYGKTFGLFDTLILTMSRWDPNEPDGFARTRSDYEAFTRYLREQYAGTGKTFILGFWEGDNALMVGDAAVAWCRARHEGIGLGREGGTSDVRVLEMIECNHDGISLVPPDKLFTQEVSMANALFPRTSADLYSFSSWEDIPPAPRRSLGSAQDYLASQAPDSDIFGARNIMLGECGVNDSFHAGQAYVDVARQVLGEARAWGTPYVVWWLLSGRECGLVDAKWYGGRKAPLFHTFWSAYHGADDALVIDDFSEADLSDGGRLLNHLGGEHEAYSTHGTGRVQLALLPEHAPAMEPGPSPQPSPSGRGGGLRVMPQGEGAPGERRGWRTDLGGLDASGYDLIACSLTGATDDALVELRDLSGRAHALAWELTLRLSRFADHGVDVSGLASAGVLLAGDTDEPVEVQWLAFARRGAGKPGTATDFAREPPSYQGPFPPKSVAVPGFPAGGETAFVLGGLDTARVPAEGRVERFEVEAAETSEPLLGARLCSGGSELRLPYRIPPAGRAWAEPGRTGGLQFAAPSREKRFADYAARGASLSNLRWEPEYAVLMLERPKERGTIRFDIGSPYPIVGARLMLQGRKGPHTHWGVTVTAGGERYEAESVDTFGWVERERFRLPDTLPRTQWLTLEYWIEIDTDEKDWVWDGSVCSLTASLDLDASAAPSLRLSADEPGTYLDRAGEDARRLVTVRTQQ